MVLELQRKTFNMVGSVDRRTLALAAGVGLVGGSTVSRDTAQAVTSTCTEGTQNIANLVGSVIGWAMALAGLLFVLIGVLGAIEWMTAGGNMGKVSKAQNRLKNAVIGLVVLALVFVIQGVILDLLRGSNTGASGDNTKACTDTIK